MLVIATAVTLEHVLTSGCAPGLTPILHRYQPLIADEQLAHLFVVQPGDRETDLESIRQRPFELWEFIISRSGWFEAVFVLSDDGSGHVVLVPDINGVDEHLLATCRTHAVTDN